MSLFIQMLLTNIGLAVIVIALVFALGVKMGWIKISVVKED